MYLKESSESSNDSLLKKISMQFLRLGLNPDTDEFEVNKALDMFNVWQPMPIIRISPLCGFKSPKLDWVPK